MKKNGYEKYLTETKAETILPLYTSDFAKYGTDTYLYKDKQNESLKYTQILNKTLIGT